MWYLAEILLGQPKKSGQGSYQCESCNVLFEAGSAEEAYRRAVSWGEAYAAEPPATMRLLGVSHLTTIGQKLGDGVEICGRFFEEPDVWDRLDQFVPPQDRLKAIQWERRRDTPLGEILNPDQVAQLKRVLGEDA
jgi:hypothetical protein